MILLFWSWWWRCKKIAYLFIVNFKNTNWYVIRKRIASFVGNFKQLCKCPVIDAAVARSAFHGERLPCSGLSVRKYAYVVSVQNGSYKWWSLRENVVWLRYTNEIESKFKIIELICYLIRFLSERTLIVFWCENVIEFEGLLCGCRTSG